MYAVGKVGTFLATSVYTVSGPFHPFGGAVDIIVVQQEDGTFKSSPWYVKFGKFQGVLKRREKKVFVAVNDGDADFHMYLDHKGEAYFLKDAQGEEVAAFSPTEAASSGDENSSHTLALEYPRVEEIANPRPELSEEEKGDDLELRFEGRDASKQLIQQSVEDRATGRLTGEEINAQPGNYAGVLEIQESPRTDAEGLLGDTQAKSLEAGGKAESTNGKVMHVLLNKAIGLEAGVESTPASALVANALISLQSPLTDDALLSPTEAVKMSTKVRRSSNNSGTVIYGLLNQAIGLQPSHEAGRGLLAAAVLASLRKAVLSDSSLITPQNHVGLVELAEGSNLHSEKNHEDASSGCPVGDIKEEVPALDSTSNPNVAHSGTSNGNTSDDGMGMKTASSLGGLSESRIDQPELEVPIRNGTISPPRNPQFFDLMKTLEVRKLEILEKTLVVEVQEHVEKDRLVSVGSDCVKDIVEADGRVDSIVVDRQQVMERVHGLQGSSDTVRIPSKHAQDPKSTYEENKKYDEASKLVSVHVDKRLVKNLQKALTTKIDEGPKLNLAKEKDVSTPDTEIVVPDSENTQNVRRPEVIPTLGQELPIDSDGVPSATLEVVGDDSTTDMSTPGKELALLKPPVNLSEASSPRMKAAIDLEMAWREVVEKAATTLKGAPYATNKKLSHSLSYKKKGLENDENKKPDSPGRLPQLQSERKSWGGWLWGGSSAALQFKRTNEQGSSMDGKNAPGELSMGPLDVVNDTGLRDPSGATSELEIVTKSGTHSMHAVEGSDSNGEAEEQVAHSESDSGPTESGKAGADNWGSRENPEDHQLELGQQKSPGGPPPKRRSWIGLLSRSSTNQSSLSSASSLRSNEDDLQPVFDGLKRETSLERAESVVDLLEESWAKGSPAHRGRIRDGRIAHREQDGATGGEVAEGSRAGAVSELVGDMGDVLASPDPDDGLDSRGPTHSHHQYSPDTTEPKLTVPQLIGTQEETSIPAPKCDEGKTKNRKVDADDVGGNQQEINVTTKGSDIVTTSIPVDHASTEDTDVLLMSLDGHLVRAPVGLSNREAPLLADDKSNEVPLLSDHSVKLFKGGGNSPRKLVCFAGVPDERPDTHNFAGNGMQQTEEGTATKQSDAASDESDGRAHHDASEGKTASSDCEGLKGLAHLLENDSVGIGEQKMGGFRGLTTDGALDQLGPHSQSAEMPKTNGRDEIDTEIDASAPEEFDDMRAMVFEKLEEELDGDAPEDSDEGQLERFYSSKDLTEVEEEEESKATKLKRNMSLYMDAVSGEDDEDSAGSAHENDRDDRSRDRSGPIGIPGALDLAQSISSEKGMQILRSASESLPEIRRDLVNSEMLSPRLTLSRSLDSAPSPTVLSLQTGQQTAASNGVLTAWPSNRSPVSSLGKGAVEAFVADRTPEKGKEDSDQLQGRMYKPDSQQSTAGSSSSSNVDDGGKVPETGFELSLCRHLLKEMMGVEAAAQAFTSEKITLEEFKKSGSTIAANDKLVVRVGGRYYPWVVAAPIVLGILAFGQVLIAPNEGAIAVEQPIVAVDGQAAANTSIPLSGGGWKLWPFVRRPKTPERGAVVSREAMLVATEAALKSSLTAEYLRMAGYYKRPRKVRTNCPSSQQLASLNLKEGSNNVTFTFETRVWGKQQVDARIYLWKWNTRIVISDVDGTITKSDVLGQVMPLMGKDWTQLGVARLYSAIKKNGYELMFLSARAISQAYITRQFLENIKQDGEVLPDGPMVISPDGLFPSLYREVIRRAPHEFKIACLEDIKSLFPPESKPFYAGFGNRDTDELSYLKVGIPKGKIFIINPKGEVVVNNQVDVKSYTSLHKLVDDMFPAMSFTEQEDYNEWNFWKLPLPDIDDEPSVKGEGGSNSRKSVNKSGRRS